MSPRARFPMQSKPCSRSGCAALIWEHQPYRLAHRLYCSLSCGVLARRAAGWAPPTNHLTSEQCRQAGLAAGEARRRRAARKVAAEVMDLLPVRRLEDDERRLLLAVAVRAWRRGYERGRIANTRAKVAERSAWRKTA